MDTNTVKCPGCGGQLPFDSKIGKWRCPHCQSIWDDDQVLSMTRDSDLDTKSAEQSLSVYRCQSCGAEVVGDDTTSATSCAFCGNPIVLKGRLEGVFRPSRIIPFTHTKEQAIEAFREVLTQEHFVPDEFTERKCLEKVTPIYIPFWLYSGKVKQAIIGCYSTQSSERSGNYIITRTTQWHVDMEGEAEFSMVPADGSLKFDDKMMDSIEPFDYTALKPFNYAYLSGFMAEKYDSSASDNAPRAVGRMGAALQDMMANEHKTTLSITQSSSKQEMGQPEYVLLPVWVFNTRYDSKEYIYAMNGQTGKMIGETPLSKAKMWKFGIMLFGGIILFFELIFFLYYILGFD